jgi:cold shock CspA family protein
MPGGWIKKVMPDKGFGFIVPAAQGPDVFFHRSAARPDEFLRMGEGQPVLFELQPEADAAEAERRGPRARSVRIATEEEVGPRPQEELNPLERHQRARGRKPTWRR